MPTETEHYTDEEILRDAERGIDAERTPEFTDDEEREDELEITKETDDPALQDILLHKGGHPEDWELTYKGTGEYVFNGSEVINAKTGESWTKKIEGESDEANIATHHAMLEQWKNGESLTRLPDFEEEKDNGDVVLHVTHMIRGADNSVTYEIRSTVISQREEEDVVAVDEEAEKTETYAHVEFQEDTLAVAEEYVEPLPETAAYAHETTFDSSTPIEMSSETPAAQEVAPTIRTEQRLEIVSENPSGEAAEKTEEKIAPDAWLYDLLKDNIFVPAPKQHETQESAPVIAEKFNTEVIVEQPIMIPPEVVSVEQPIKRPEPFVAPIVEQVPSHIETVTGLVSEVAVPTVEYRQTVGKVEQVPVEKREMKMVAEPVARVEKVQPIILKTPGLRKREVILRPEVHSEKKPVETVAGTVREKPRDDEMVGGPSVVEPKTERALTGQEILLRAIGLPTISRVQTREFAHMEGLRPARYSPPQQDEQRTPRSSGRVSSLNGISMRRAT